MDSPQLINQSAEFLSELLKKLSRFLAKYSIVYSLKQCHIKQMKLLFDKTLAFGSRFPYFREFNNPFKVAEHSFQEPMPNSPLLLSYLCFGALFLQESRLTTVEFILAFWLRCVLLP